MSNKKEAGKFKPDMQDLGIAVQMNAIGDLIPSGEASAPAKQTKPTRKKGMKPMDILDDIKAKQKKEKRVQLVMTESLFEAIKAQAEKSGRSVNSFVCTVMGKVIGFDD